MNRIKVLIAAVCTAAALAVPVSSASTTRLPEPPGPPHLSGGLAPHHGAMVHHCKADGGKGVIVTNKNGAHGNGEGCAPLVGIGFLPALF